jgi:hypothetical protein
VEVRFVELTGSEFFQVGYAKAGATAPTTPQAILGSTKPITTGAKTPLLLVPDFAGQAVTVTLNAGVGGLIDAGRVAAKDSSATVGSSAVPNLTIQGDRTDTVTLIGSMADLQTFLQTEGNLRYSVVADAWLKVSLTSARMATTTDGVKFTTAAYTAESVEAVRLLASVASGSGSTGGASTVAAGSFSRLFAQWLESDEVATADLAVVGVKSATSDEPAAAPVTPVTKSTAKRTNGQPYRVVTVASVPLDQAFVGRLGQGAALPAARSRPVGMSEEPMGFTSSADWDSGEFQASKKTGQRSNRAVRGMKGVWA